MGVSEYPNNDGNDPTTQSSSDDVAVQNSTHDCYALNNDEVTYDENGFIDSKWICNYLSLSENLLKMNSDSLDEIHKTNNDSSDNSFNNSNRTSQLQTKPSDSTTDFDSSCTSHKVMTPSKEVMSPSAKLIKLQNIHYFIQALLKE